MKPVGLLEIECTDPNEYSEILKTFHEVKEPSELVEKRLCCVHLHHEGIRLFCTKPSFARYLVTKKEWFYLCAKHYLALGDLLPKRAKLHTMTSPLWD